MIQNLKIKLNTQKINSVADFVNINGRITDDGKEVFFVRFKGSNASLLRDVATMDKIMDERMKRGKALYIHINQLPSYFTSEEITFYTSSYEKWVEKGKQSVVTKCAKDGLITSVLSNACDKCISLLRQHKKQMSTAMEKNFLVKLLCWFDYIFTGLPSEWSEKKTVKIVAENIVREQEYIFFYLLTLLGCSVLLLQSKADLDKGTVGSELSNITVIGDFLTESIAVNTGCRITGAVPTAPSEPQRTMPTVKIPDRPNRRRIQPTATQPLRSTNTPPVRVTEPIRASVPAASVMGSVNIQRPSAPRKEKSYEELAALASSIVLIAMLDRSGEIKGTGSGIMIGSKGFILTNCHVATAGVSYAVYIEGEEKPCTTDEIIKYNRDLDLAVIRIERSLNPLPIYSGSNKLVRGQRVVAIGSPLGLFNTVSDGIISGFRRMRNMDMIQFTAPISNGSSGGAVLNMYGEVIGISTAGIDEGQNLNLAVGYEDIIPFVKGFMV